MPQLKNDASSFIHFPYLVVCLDYLLSNLMGFYTLYSISSFAVLKFKNLHLNLNIIICRKLHITD